MAEYDKPPIEEDIRSEDHEYNPAIEPQSSKAWLNLLQESEDAFEDWNHHCDNHRSAICQSGAAFVAAMAHCKQRSFRFSGPIAR